MPAKEVEQVPPGVEEAAVKVAHRVAAVDQAGGRPR
jgi:hypothetical protein